MRMKLDLVGEIWRGRGSEHPTLDQVMRMGVNTPITTIPVVRIHMVPNRAVGRSSRCVLTPTRWKVL
jgi:hypothetical protein